MDVTAVDVRRTAPEDAPAYLDYVVRNRERLAPFEPTHTDDYYTLGSVLDRLTDERRIQFAAFLDGRIVGQAALSNLSTDPGVYCNSTIGYDVDGEHRRVGVATKLVRHAVQSAFSDHGRHRVEAGTLVDNVASQRVLDACGFVRIGVSPLHVKIAGAWRDHVLYAITPERWEDLGG
ncbi:MAG: putative ribosomal-protein (S5)-alanine N-acetyltransferase [Thermoleophilia bacterium]|nr:putative ribosomal-protein (S5)-alanine N-acetyltransferase [Thermoleophilia bacterium]